MSKATVMIQFNNQTEAFWSAVVGNVPDSDIREVQATTVAGLPVESYSLDDHQFVRVKCASRYAQSSGKTGQKATIAVMIPRSMVMTIVEGPTGTDIGYLTSAALKK